MCALAQNKGGPDEAACNARSLLSLTKREQRPLFS
jgi:hypothetical protein